MKPAAGTVWLLEADQLQSAPQYTAEHTTCEDTATCVGLFRWDFHASTPTPLLTFTAEVYSIQTADNQCMEMESIYKITQLQ